MKLSPKQTSVIQAIALINMKEGLGCNVMRAHGLQQDLAQGRASLYQEFAEAQAIQGKELLLADIIEEEMSHQTQV